MPLTRQQIANIWRPTGPRAISVGNAWSSAGALLIGNGLVDLTTPLSGIRIVLKLRDVIGTANMTSMNPLAYLNLISRIAITGTNSRTGGNTTLWDMDLATA